MSVFSNSAADAAGQGGAYTTALRDLVHGRDAVAVLRETPAALRTALDGFAAAERTRPEKPGKWSARDVLQHLADAEVAFGWRLRLIVAQERPALTPWDQDAWAMGLRYPAADAEHALEEFAAARRGNLRLVERAGAAALDRTGLHAEWSEIRLRDLLEIEAGHDVLHLRQIERIRRAIAPARGADTAETGTPR